MSSIATIDQLQLILQQTIHANDVASAQQALDLASAVVRSHCKRHITRSRDTITLDASSGSVSLPDDPVVSVHSVTANNAELTGWTLTSGGVITLAQAVDTVSVDYTHGFSDDDPRAGTAVLVTLRLAIRLWTNPQSRASYSADSLNYTAGADMTRLLTPDEQRALRSCTRTTGAYEIVTP